MKSLKQLNIKRKNIIGLILCLIGLSLLAIFTPILLIPSSVFILILYAISIKIQNRIVSYLINSLTILVFIYFCVIYRLETSESIVFESRLRYQVLDFSLDNFVRTNIEIALSNHRVFLAGGTKRISKVFVDKATYNRLTPEDPWTMRKKNYSIKARFEINKLVFGGYSIAKVTNYQIVNEPPMITK